MNKILVADDSGVFREVFRKYLIDWGYSPVFAKDGEAAMRIMENDDFPRLLLLDWNMPGITGPELCFKLRIKDSTKSVFIILTTSRNKNDDIIIGLEAGADDFISKPFRPDELKARLSTGHRILTLHKQALEEKSKAAVLETAGAICHEFNQPLQIIKGWAEILLSRINKIEKECIHGVNEILKSTERLEKLTYDLMNISEYKTKGYMNGKKRIVDFKKGDKDQGGK